ncbi:hypothetical protein BYT27DRAFT_7219729 [Phlegmacium glaucopus]|nr:hypothetical protein BYT27DRAFT_7219729 [Phlegmacium glaucopus]
MPIAPDPNQPKPRSNQHLSLPPDDELFPVVLYYWGLGLNDKKIVEHALDHFDRSLCGLSRSSIKRKREKWGMLGTRQPKHTFETIEPFVKEIKDAFHPWVLASWQMVLAYLNSTEREAVEFRKQKGFRRKRFWAAGINDVWTV